MNLCRETVKLRVPPGNRRELNSVLEQYVAGFKPRGRPGGRSYLRSQQPIHELSGLGKIRFPRKWRNEEKAHVFLYVIGELFCYPIK